MHFMDKYYIVITPFFPEKGSFRGPYILDQVKAILRNSDYKVVVMKPHPFYLKADDYEFDGIKVYRFKDYTIPSNMWPNKFCDWLTSHAMITKLRSIGVDINSVVIAHGHVTKQGAYANYLKLLNPKIKTIVQHHGFDVMSVKDGKLGKKKFHELQCIRHGVEICNSADLNVGVSQLTLEYVLKQSGIKLKNQYILYNGVDTTVFYNKSAENKVFRKDKKHLFTIGCIANFWPLKDQITLIKAIEFLVQQGIRNIRTIFIGTGKTLPGCQSYIKKQGLTDYFVFRKEVMHDQLPDFYHSLDLFVLPSYWEAFGCVYTEAFACGVPFIGVKGQGIEEIIPKEDRNKWLIDKGDALGLAELIRKNMDCCEKKQCLSVPYKIDDLILPFLEYVKKCKDERFV